MLRWLYPRSLVCALLLVLPACAGSSGSGFPLPPPEPDFPGLILRLSEQGGFFPSDNLVSNETSYQHVLGKMDALGVKGGVYVGVGPDQNFTYIAAIRPEIAFLIDIRRDNLLHHLLFKAVFERARNRLEFLSILTGRPVPDNALEQTGTGIESIVAQIDAAAPDSRYFRQTATAIVQTILSWRVPLTDADLRVVQRIHEAFRRHGLDLRYAQVPRYPTWRQLILETDLEGRRRNYLANDTTFRYVQAMQRRHRIVPVTGDVAGEHALAAIGNEVRSRGLTVTTLYISNVEQYLMRGATFPVYAGTLLGLPFDSTSVIIRSYFGRGAPLPQTIRGHYSTQLLELFTDFANQIRSGGYDSYIDLVTRHALPLRTGRDTGAISVEAGWLPSMHGSWPAVRGNRRIRCTDSGGISCSPALN
ncbi:MAG: hypothetical protein ACREL7_10610 [Longimicrobiales bacterium]